MSIRKIGNRWQVRLRVGGGRRVERTLPPGAKIADARELEANLRRAQIDAAVGRKPKYLIDDAIDRWVESSARQLKSWDAELQYRVDILRAYTPSAMLAFVKEQTGRTFPKNAAGYVAASAALTEHAADLARALKVS